MADMKQIRGDLFSITGQFIGPTFVGWTGKSQLRKISDDSLVTELEFSWINNTQGLFLVQTKATLDWPIGSDLVFDVQVTSLAGIVVSTKAVTVEVVKDVTRDV